MSGFDVEIALWEFPESDLAAWQELTGEAMTYGQYLAGLAGIETGQQRLGRNTRRVRMTVAEMRRRLEEEGFSNDPAHRAAIIGMDWKPKEQT